MRRILTGLISIIIVAAAHQNVVAQDFDDLPLLQFERQLNSILRTRLPEEKLFVARVVKHVGDGKIPRALVNASFKYVLKKRYSSSYRFVYFVRVLQFLGGRERVVVPVFDFSIYNQRR